MARFQLLQSGSPSEKSSGFLTKDVLLGTVHYPPASGQILAFQAKPAQVYRLVNAQDQSLVKGQRLTRLGDNLIIEVNGTEILSLQGFFENPTHPAPEHTLADVAPPTGAKYLFDAELPHSAAHGLIDASSGQGGAGLLWSPGMKVPASIEPMAHGWVPMAALGSGSGMSATAWAGGGAMVASGLDAVTSTLLSNAQKTPSITAITGNILQGVVTLGDVSNGHDLVIDVYSIDKDGTSSFLQFNTKVNSSGAYSVNLGSYTGAVRLVVKSTGTNADYLDEATGKPVNLSTTISALAVVSGTGAQVTVNLTPLTHLAYLANTKPSVDNIAQVNQAMGKAFGLDDILSTPVVATTNDQYLSSTSSAGKAYGAVLAALSGLDTQTKSTETSLKTMSQNISIASDGSGAVTATLNNVAKAKLLDGASVADAQKPAELTRQITTLISATGQSEAIAKFSAYADSNSNPAPQLADYATAGVTGVNANNLAAVNANIDAATKTSSDSLSKVQALVNDANLILTKVSLSNTSLNENTVVGNGIDVGTVAVNDPDGNGNQGLLYSLSGTDAASFSLVGNKLQYKGSTPVYQSKSSYNIIISSTDGDITKAQAFTITVNQVKKDALVLTSGATGKVAENAATSSPIYSAAAANQDGTAATNGVVYSLKPNSGDVDLLNMDRSTGVVTLKTSADHESGKTSYRFTVVATKGELSAEQAVTVSVTDVNEAPVITASSKTFSVWGGGQTVTLLATDPDDTGSRVDDRFWSSQTTGNNLSIAANGQVTVAPFQFQTGESVSQTMTATVADRSAGGLTDSATITVSIKPFAVFNGAQQVGVFDTLEAAVAAALEGQTVKIAAGDYKLQSEIKITKAIKIEGLDSNTSDATQSVVITNTGGARTFVVGSSIAGTVSISGISVKGGTEAVSVDGAVQDTDLTGLSITNSTFSGQQNAGLVIGLNNPASSLGTLTVSGVVFDQSAANISKNTDGRSAAGIMMWGFDGQATIRDTTIKGSTSTTSASPWYGIHIQGAENNQLAGTAPYASSHAWYGSGPALAGGANGTIALSNIKVVGGFAKSGMAIYNYSDISGISGSAIDLTASGSGWDQVLTVNGIKANYSVAGWGLNLSALQKTQLGGEASSQGAANSTITGSANNDHIVDSVGGNDLLIGGLGNDVLNGGDGQDAALLFSSPTAFRFDATAMTMYLTSQDGTDTLLNMEQVLVVNGSTKDQTTYWMHPFLNLPQDPKTRTTQLADNLKPGDVVVFGGAKDITLEDALTISSEKATFWGNDTVTVRYTADQAPTDTQRASLIALGVDDFKVL